MGVLRFDDEHRHLVGLLNRVQQTLSEARAEPELVSLLPELGWLVRNHFQAEEQHMREYGYPELAAHRHAHEQLAAQTAIELEQLRVAPAADAGRAFASLACLLLDHIERVDGAYGAYLEQLRSYAPARPRLSL